MNRPDGQPAAGWNPDPFQRHEYRYWDGAAWTDQVSDGGVQATDPPVAAATGAPIGYGGGFPPSAAPPRSGPNTKLLGIGGVAAVAALVAVAVVVLGGGGGGGCLGEGSSTRTIAEDDFEEVCVSVGAGEMAAIRIDPDSDLDVRFSVVWPESLLEDDFFTEADSFTDDLTDNFDDFFTDALEDVAPDEDAVGFVEYPNDSDGEGGEEATVLYPMPRGVTYDILISGYDGQGGEIEIEIEKLSAPDEFDELDADNIDDFYSEFYSSDVYSDYYSEFLDDFFS